MQKQLTLIIFLLVSGASLAQDSVLEPAPDGKEKKDTIIYNRVLIAPFESRMYTSDADREIASGANLPPRQLVEMFRSGIVATISAPLSSYFPAKMLFSSMDTLKELDKIYASVAYQYEPLYKKPVKKKILKKAKGQDEKNIAGGQLTVKEDTVTKFMNAEVKEKELFTYFYKKYGTDLFIFINQFDIKNDLSDYASVGTGEYNREIRVHYTVFNGKGERLFGSMAKTQFPSSENNVGNIIRNHFPDIANQIASRVKLSFTPPEEKKK